MGFLAADPAVAVALAAVLGLLVGSFLNVVIHRLPRMLEREWAAECAQMRGEEPPSAPRYNLVVPRSACPSCGHRITALENVPVLSWLVLRGRCSACGTAISPRYPAVELLTAILTAAAVWRFGAEWRGLAACAFLWTLVALTFIDADTQLLPDNLTLPLLWAGLVANAFFQFSPIPLRCSFDGPFARQLCTDWGLALGGAILGYVVLWLVYWAFKLVTGREGMGHGDFKLLAALGAWLGWPMVLPVILASSVVGALLGIAMIALRGRDRAQPLPFGPYLAIAGAVALFWPRPLLLLVAPAFAP